MRSYFTCSLLFLLQLFYTPSLYAAFGIDPRLDWYTLQSEHFEIHYHEGEENLARQVAEISERTHIRITEYFDWTPRSKTQVMLIDRMDFSNGFATPLPSNLMGLIVSPPDDPTFIDNYDNYLEFLITHEYTHIVHLDKVTGAAKVMRSIFGRFDWLILTAFPNAYQPPWMIEGIATYHESSLNPDVGRGNNNYYRGLMRNEVVNGVKPLRQVNQPVTEWPLGTTRYLYGVYYYKFIQENYGDEGIKRWVAHHSNNVMPFMINNSSSHAFRKQLDGMWHGFNQYLDEQFADDIKQRQDNGITKARQISQAGYYTGYPRSLANGDVYYIKTDLASKSKLMLLKNGASNAKELTVVYGERFDLHPQNGLLMTEIDFDYSTNFFSDLYVYDLNTLDKQQLTSGQRYVYATWHPNGEQIVAIHNESSIKRLDLLSKNGEKLETLWTGTNQENISQPQWSADGKFILASVWRPAGYWNLEKFDLATRQWQAITNTRHIEIQAVFSHDGKSILFSADYDGSFNIYRRELASGDTIKLTNVMGGAIAATENATTQDLVYMDLGSNGYNIYHAEKANLLNTKFALAESTKLTSSTKTKPASTDATKNDYNITDYSGLSELIPKSWFPYLAVDDERTEVGALTFGADPLRRHQYVAIAAYDWKNSWATGGFSYLYDRWNPTLKLTASRTMLSTRDDNDDLVGFTSSDEYGAELLVPFLKRKRQWVFHLGYVAENEATKKSVKPYMPQITLNDELAGIALSYNSSSRYARSISENDGQKFRLIYEDNDAFTSDYSGQVTTMDWRGYLRITGQHVLATRFVYGRGTDAPKPFQLGGTSNGFNMTNPAAAPFVPTSGIFNRRKYALRGYPSGLSGLRGRRMAMVEAEWRLPLYQLERGFMAPPIGLHQVYGSVFYNAGEAWQDSLNTDDIRHGAGIEINTELVIGYGLGLGLRFGYAHGFDAAGENQFYLKIGKTF